MILGSYLLALRTLIKGGSATAPRRHWFWCGCRRFRWVSVLVWVSAVLVDVGGSGVGLWFWCGSLVLAWVSGSGMGLWFCCGSQWLCFLGAWRTVSFAGVCLGGRCSGVILSGAQGPLRVVQLPCLGGFPWALGLDVSSGPCLALSPWYRGAGAPGSALAHACPCPCPLTDAVFTFLGFSGLRGPR